MKWDDHIWTTSDHFEVSNIFGDSWNCFQIGLSLKSNRQIKLSLSKSPIHTVLTVLISDIFCSLIYYGQVILSTTWTRSFLKHKNVLENTQIYKLIIDKKIFEKSITVKFNLKTNINWSKQKLRKTDIDGKRLQSRIWEPWTSKTGTPKALPRKCFNLENGNLEFNLEKVNIDRRHSIPVTTVGNLG